MRMKCSFLFYYRKLFSWMYTHFLGLLQQISTNQMAWNNRNVFFPQFWQLKVRNFRRPLFFQGLQGRNYSSPFPVPGKSAEPFTYCCIIISASVVRGPPPLLFRSLIRSLLWYFRSIWKIRDYLFIRKFVKKKKKRTLFPNKVTFRGFGHYIWMSLGGSFSAYHRMDTPQFFNLHTCCWQLFSVFGYYKYEHSWISLSMYTCFHISRYISRSGLVGRYGRHIPNF